MRKILLGTFILATFSLSDVKAQCSINYQPYSYCGSPDAIMSFTLNGIATVGNNGCNSSSGYSFFSSPVRTLIVGSTYAFSATTGTFPEGFAIWIDLNGNGFFESSEQLWTSSSAGSSHSGNITIPSTAISGQVRMRTKCHYNDNPGAGDACTDVTWGETEDYNVFLCKPPVISAMPIDTFACEGGNTTFSITAANAGNYQWQVNNGAGWADVANGASYAGATTPTLNIINAATTMNLAEYRCIAMANCSNSAKDTSETARLTIMANTNIVKHTLTDTSCIGLQTRMYVKNEGVILNRRWQIWSNIERKYVDVPSVPFTSLGDTLLVQNIPDTLNGALIRCIVEGMCGSDTTSDIRMVVNALPEVVTSPADVTTEPGKTVDFQVVAAGVGIRYQWQAGYKDTFANINEGGIYKGVKTDRLSVMGVSRVQDGFQFRCIIRGSGSCDVQPDTSNFGLLFVEPPASVGAAAAGNALVIFPNPASGNSILVKMENNPIGKFSYHIVDKVGRVVSAGSLNSTGITNIDITALTPGIYSVQIIDKDGSNVSVPSRFTRL